MGGEMWYEIYKITGFMAMLTGGAALLVHAGRAGAARWPVRRIPIAVVSGAAALLYLWGLGQFNYRHGFVTGPRNYPQKLSWGWGMTMADPEVPYITAADKQAVVALAMAAAGDHPAPVIEFPGTGDSFLCSLTHCPHRPGPFCGFEINRKAMSWCSTCPATSRHGCRRGFGSGWREWALRWMRRIWCAMARRNGMFAPLRLSNRVPGPDPAR
jgi:hypothetical protein